jgi:branched-chain amino acid transport system ATP-binding protein
METLLETRDLTIAFGGHVAVDGVSVKIPKNRLTSIIGPNGAGKTTFFNLLSGQLKPTRGSIRFKGREITHLASHARTREGIDRSFQITNVFPGLTVRENVRLAVQSRMGIRYPMWTRADGYPELEEKTTHWLEKVRLLPKAAMPAKNLTHGEQRQLEIAMLLALETELLLLDEPTAGMSREEVPAILEVIRLLREEGERTILLIEHKMDLILSLSDRVLVLAAGRLLAEGTPEEIMKDERVQSAYLGGDAHAP